MTDPLIGHNLGQNRVIQQIGQGGMATVYKAYQPGLDRNVAVKVLPPIHAQQPGFSQRFEREAKAIANLNHPNILPVYDSGQENGYSFIVMRYVEGATTLKTVMGPHLSLAEIVNLIGQIGGALNYAHQQGIVHRDVKPGNVLMDGNWALLTDFGLAKMTETSVKLTGTGVGIGTPAYMSPEQGQGQPVDHRTDIYALGIILFEMLTGQIPHDAETPFAIVLKRSTEPLPLPRTINPDIPESVERVVLKALATKPDDRYQSAEELVDALRAASEEVGVAPDATKISIPPTVVTEAKPQKSMSKIPFVIIGGILMVALCLIAGLGLFFISQTGTEIALEDTTATVKITPKGTKQITLTPELPAALTGTVEVNTTPTAELIDRFLYKTQDGDSESLYATNFDLDGPYLLASGADNLLGSRLSPDGTYVIVRVERDEKDSLYVVEFDGSNQQIIADDKDYAYGFFTPTEANKMIVRWDNEDKYNLIVIDADGSNPVTLVSGADTHISSSWAADWQKVALSVKNGDTYNLYVVNLDGSDRQTIATSSESGLSPKLLADNRLAYTVDKDDLETLYISNTDGSNPIKIISGVYNAWAYNIAYSGPREKLLMKVKETRDDPESLYAVDALSGQKIRLLSGDYVGAYLSPNEEWVLAYTRTDLEDKDDEYRLYLISIDGMQQKEIFGPSQGVKWGSTSPDEVWMTAVREQDNNHYLYLVNTDGVQQEIFAAHNLSDSYAYIDSYFSPDSKRLLVRVTDNDPCCYASLHLIDIESGEQVTLTDNVVWGASATFTSDGQYIIFDSNRNGERAISLADADGSNIRKLIDGYSPYVAGGQPSVMIARPKPKPTPTATPTSAPAE